VATTDDIERLEKTLQIVRTEIDDLAENVNALQSEQQKRGLIRGRLIYDPDMPIALRSLDCLVEEFDALRASHQQMLQHQKYTGELLNNMLTLTNKLVGMGGLVSELQVRNAPHATFDQALQLYGNGSRALDCGRINNAVAEFNQLARLQPNSQVASFALDTANIVALPVNDPSISGRVQSLLRRIPEVPVDVLQTTSLSIPSLSDDQVLAGFARHQQLQSVIIWNCSLLTDNGIAALCRLVPNLTKLSIRRGMQITDRSVPALCSLRQLRHLLLWQTRVTNEGANRLRNCLSSLRDLNIRR
jgi:hypothetical protein